MTATPEKPKHPAYRITLIVRTSSHPRKWIADVIDDCLNQGEELLDWDIQEVDNG